MTGRLLTADMSEGRSRVWKVTKNFSSGREIIHGIMGISFLLKMKTGFYLQIHPLKILYIVQITS